MNFEETVPEAVLKLFWSKVKKKPGNGCWEWQGVRNLGGYGVFIYKQVRHLAHRFSWEATHQLNVGSLLIMHKCDNPPCVNPKHLVPGTHKDNAHDKVRKKRHSYGPEHVRRARALAGGKKTSDKASKYRGVYWAKGEEKWRAQGRIHGVKRHFGYFDTEEEARTAYKNAIKEFLGDCLEWTPPIKSPPVKKTQEEKDQARFWKTVKKNKNKCWLWGGRKNKNGEAIFQNKAKIISAQDISWILYHGTKPSNSWIIRQCGNKLCVNPEHLTIGNKMDRFLELQAWGIDPLGNYGACKKSSHHSKYRGVIWKKQYQKWCSRIRYEGKTVHLGYFDDEEEAHQAYRRAQLTKFIEQNSIEPTVAPRPGG